MHRNQVANSNTSIKSLFIILIVKIINQALTKVIVSKEDYIKTVYIHGMQIV